jgi:hypothetical protein
MVRDPLATEHSGLRCEVDAIGEDVLAFCYDVPEVDPDAEFDSLLRRGNRI